MKKIYILLGSLLFITACSTDLDQSPSNIASADSLTDFTGVLNAAYYYQLSTSAPMALMGDFRADNALMLESPNADIDVFNNALPSQEDQFFGPFYTALYKSILSANIVIENSTNDVDVAEAKFLRGLSYFKLVMAFGDVPVNLSASPSLTDTEALARQPKASVYSNVIIPDLTDAMAVLSTEIVDGRASKYAAQGMLGKVYATMGDYASAVPHLADVVNGAASAGIVLEPNFSEIFGVANEVGNTEIIFATQKSASIADEYNFATDFSGWFSGNDSKSDFPIDADLIAAFDAAGDVTRKAVTLDDVGTRAIKFPIDGADDHDWIELRLADVILLYAEALNETGSPASTVLPLLDDIRTRAGLASLTGTATTQAEVRQAILDERRLELALEGHRWFDLIRAGVVDAEMGEAINTNYYLFPIPVSEVLATNGVITQNPGY
ncbi:RagB/SusD family nutrient uptake outer membrane protein [uncultured Maribacter sp.]|uniref:RagB/SusD family nutrient uptake outer membrane protein n=1 Tax=uncultured Maribacter sp. TaxID=431308 RepID=UPI0026141527|nr:RagB/SusD family nutrient uptake outer membrane protein [uncultured Maribacter sp.]